jgi:hypothetical protein
MNAAGEPAPTQLDTAVYLPQHSPVLYLTEVMEHGSKSLRNCRPMMSSNGRQRMRTDVRRTTLGEEHDATGYIPATLL